MKFTPEMFGDDGRGTTRWGLQGFDRQIAWQIAQYAFDKWLSEQPVVYRYGKETHITDRADWAETGDSEGGLFTFSHTARLVDIREIEK